MEPQPPPTTDTPGPEPLLTPDEFRALVARLECNFKRDTFMGQFVCTTLGVEVLLTIFWALGNGSAIYLLYGLALIVTTITVFCVIGHFQEDRGQGVRRAVQCVESTQDVVTLGGILDLYWYAIFNRIEKYSICTACVVAFHRLMPLIQRTDIEALDEYQTSKLYVIMGSYPDEVGSDLFPHWQLTLQALHMFERCGDKRHLTNIVGFSKDEHRSDEVRTTAARCAEFIRERVAREKDKDVLLRAGRKLESPATLLRPSAENADTLPQQLLRAAASDEGNTPA